MMRVAERPTASLRKFLLVAETFVLLPKLLRCAIAPLRSSHNTAVMGIPERPPARQGLGNEEQRETQELTSCAVVLS
jgi:hypothetical protein